MSIHAPRVVPTLSLGENLRFNLSYIVPFLLRGVFVRNPFWVGLWCNLHPDPLGVRLINTLRDKYQSDYLYLNLLTTKSLLVLDRDGIREVLDNSPMLYADAKVKREGMGHFQPNAVTISRGTDWQERRRFIESVLHTGAGVHPFGDEFLALIRREVAAPEFAGPTLRWENFAHLFERITLQIIFGEGEVDLALAAGLTRLMRESNRVVGLRPSPHFAPFYARLRTALTSASPTSLAGHTQSTPHSANVHVEDQIPHWVFAMKDTLAENIVPALALILAHPELESRVRVELATHDLTTAEGIGALCYLEGCVQEAMRLWPTTPMLTRETVTATTLADIPLAAGTQVVILNSFTHRDRTLHADANRVNPERWLDGSDTSTFNHLSSGPQGCAGRELALFIAKAVLATLLTTGRYTLQSPHLRAEGEVPPTFNPFKAVFVRA